MLGKIIALVAVVAAVASAEPCGYCGGYLPTSVSAFGLNAAYGSRVLNVGCTVPVVSAVPPCAPIATPSQIVDAAVVAPTPVASIVSAPVVAPTPVASIVSAPVVSSGLLGSGCYGGYGYGSALGSCGNEVLATVC